MRFVEDEVSTRFGVRWMPDVTPVLLGETVLDVVNDPAAMLECLRKLARTCLLDASLSYGCGSFISDPAAWSFWTRPYGYHHDRDVERLP